MLLSVMSAASLAVSPLPSGDISGEFLGHVRRNAAQMLWERYDLRLTNRGTAPKTLSFCPNDARMSVRVGVEERDLDIVPGVRFAYADARLAAVSDKYVVRGFATAFDGEGWSFNCSAQTIAAGESVDVSFYFRWLSRRKGGSPFMVDTSLGRLLMQDGKATLYETPGAAEEQGD